MTPDPSIAFIILTWNSAAYVEACLESVLDLGYKNLGVFVFDNGSTDDTPRILDHMARKDSRLHIERSSVNVGTTVSRNTLLRMVPAKYDYICVLDSDTVVNRAAMDALAQALRSHPHVGVVGPTMANSAGKEQLSGRNLPSLKTKLGKVCPVGSIRRRAEASEVPSGIAHDGLLDVGYLLSACWLVPRTVFADVGLLDEKIFYAPEDVDWCVRVHAHGYRVCKCPEARIVHEYQRISRRKLMSKANWEHLKGLAYYFCKHRYLFDSSKAV